MTTVNRNWLLVLLCLLSLIFTAAGLGGIVNMGSEDGAPGSSGALIPVVIALEMIVYFVAAMVSNPRATIGMAAGTAFVLAVVRAVCASIGGILYFLIAGKGSAADFLWVWGNPIVTVVQVAIMVLAGGYLLAMTVPDLLGQAQAAALLGIGAKKQQDQPRTGLDANPTGGFIQVFSFEELAAVVKKSHGIEGFMLVSTEGLVVWRELPLRVDVDSLSAKIFGHSQAIGSLVEDSGLTKVRRLMVESREHFLFATTLDQNFSLILLFNGRVAPEEILSRIAVLAKSCREFLQWKYPSLPLRAGLSKTSSLETA